MDPAGRRIIPCFIVWTLALAALLCEAWAGPGSGAWSVAWPGSAPDCFPSSVRGGAWRLEESRSYAGQQLFDLIDGGAPLYFEYGFVKAEAARYHTAGGGEIAVECYEMLSADGAWGLWSYLSAGAGGHVRLGDTAVAGSGYVLVQSGEKFWSFTVLDRSGQDSLLAVAGALVDARGGQTTPPSLVREFVLAFPAAEDPVLFFGPLGLQKRLMFMPDRRMRVPRGVSARLAGGEVVLFGHSSARGAADQYDSLVTVARLHRERSLEGDILAEGTAGANVLLAVQRGRLVALFSGRDPLRLRRLWQEVQERLPR